MIIFNLRQFAAKLIFPALLVVLFSAPTGSQAAVPGFMKYRMGTMEGQVIHDNKPVGNAVISFFDASKGLPPLDKLGGRIPEFLGRTDAEGKFKVKLVAGQYYMGILLREEGTGFGPPKKGEVYYFADDGHGRLKKLAIEDFKQVDVGPINSSLPEIFPEKEDYFTVTGTVYEEEGGKPLEGAIVFGKITPTMRRPQYFSESTNKEGKFLLKLPPGQTFYLVARTEITGTKPQPGEPIGKYGADTYTGASSIAGQQVGGPPPGVEKKETPRIVADSIPVTGAKGETVSGLEIVMYKMPDQNKLREKNMRLAKAPDYETGYAISNLFFAYKSAKLDQRSFAELDLWVNFFTGRQDIPIQLTGHTDDVGSDEYNLKLSKQRAEAVAQYLISKGISPDRITIEGAGSAKPIADNTTEEGRSKNRRVDIKFEK